MPDQATDAVVHRDLEAVDAVLAGTRANAGMEEIEALTLALRDERPQLSPAAATRIEARLAPRFAARAGEPRRSRLNRRLSRLARPTPAWGVGLGALASVLLALVLVLPPLIEDSQSTRAAESRPASGGDAQLDAGPAGAERAGRAGDPAAVSRSAADPAFAPAPGGPQVELQPGAGVADPSAARVVERSAALVLAARPRELERVANGIIRTTDALGGFVASSTVSSGSVGATGGYFDLRVPERRLTRALAEHSRLGSVRERTQNVQDITAERASAADRLSEARAERRSVLRRLARAATPGQAFRLQREARALSRRIAAARSRLAGVDQRASFSAITVSLVADRRSGAGADDGRWTPADALRTAGRILEVAAGAALVALAVAVPVALVIASVAWLWRAHRRQRRDRVLDRP